MKVIKFEDLEIWQLSIQATKIVYELTFRTKLNRDFALRDQIRRSVISISSNMVEGFEKRNNNEFKRFLQISKGSTDELKNQLYIAKCVGYISEEEFNKLNSLLEEIAAKIGSLISYLIQHKTTHNT